MTPFAPQPEFGTTLKDRRERLGWSRNRLAKAAGISEGTLKSIETHGSLVTTRTLQALHRVSEYSDLISPSMPTMNWVSCPEVRTLDMMRELVQIFDGSGGPVDQMFCYFDAKSALDYSLITAQDAYASARRGMPTDRAVACIAAQYRDCLPVDVVALGCGDGRLEARFVQELIPRLKSRGHLYLLDISQPLLNDAQQWASQVLEGQVGVIGVHGNFHNLPRYRALLPTGADRRRVYTMLGGTFGNLSDELRFCRDSLCALKEGDILLIDVSEVYGDEDADILANDPRLNGSLPEEWVQRDAEWLRGPLQRYCKGVEAVELSTHLDRLGCPVPGSYAVEIRATVTSTLDEPRRFTLFRFKRHNVRTLIQALQPLGWEAIDGWPYRATDQLQNKRVLYAFRKSAAAT